MQQQNMILQSMTYAAISVKSNNHQISSVLFYVDSYLGFAIKYAEYTKTCERIFCNLHTLYHKFGNQYWILIYVHMFPFVTDYWQEV